MNIKTESLLALKAIHQSGNFSRAAEELGITQSALTKRIQFLEQQISTRVLSRTLDLLNLLWRVNSCL